MAVPDSKEVTRLLAGWQNGDSATLDKLIPLVYDELRRLAHHYLRQERAGHSLQTTAIVHEAYIRLAGSRPNPGLPFFPIAAKAMRQVLVDYARSRNREKRGGKAVRVTLNDAVAVAEEREMDLLNLDEALEELGKHSAQQSHIVELRYFGGLTIEQTAEVMNLSVRTVNREWERAKAWLRVLMLDKE